MQQTRVRFLGQEDPLEKEMATHSSILAWKSLWTEEPGRLQSLGLHTVRYGLKQLSTPYIPLFYHLLYIFWASLVAQTLKNLPAMRETQIQSLDWEDPLEKRMATHSSILAWRIPWTGEPGGLQSTASQRVRHG